MITAPVVVLKDKQDEQEVRKVILFLVNALNALATDYEAYKAAHP